jgi:hypothetical protein
MALSMAVQLAGDFRLAQSDAVFPPGAFDYFVE